MIFDVEGHSTVANLVQLEFVVLLGTSVYSKQIYWLSGILQTNFRNHKSVWDSTAIDLFRSAAGGQCTKYPKFI